MSENNSDREDLAPEVEKAEGAEDDYGVTEKDVEITDQQLLEELGEEPVKLDQNFDCMVFLGGLPKVAKTKVSKFKAMLVKKVSAYGNLVSDPILPVEPSGSAKGLATLEFAFAEQARTCVKALDNTAFMSKTSLVFAFVASDFEKRAEDSRTVVEPTTNTEDIDIRWWLQDERVRDQFLVRSSDTTEIFWFDPIITEQVSTQKEWTLDRFDTWSPRGSYNVCFHSKGVILRGGPDFSEVAKFQHNGVTYAQLSPCERYMLTRNYNPANMKDMRRRGNEGFATIVWDVALAKPIKGFPLPKEDDKGFAFSGDGNFLSREVKNAVHLYKMPGMVPHGDKIGIRNVSGLSWSPAQNYFAVYIPETENAPAKIGIFDAQRKALLTNRNIYAVVTCRPEWHPEGKYLAIKVTRYATKKKKQVDGRRGDAKREEKLLHRFDIFRMTEKDYPVETIDLGEVEPTHFSWEPHGMKFAIATQSELSVYSMEKYGKQPKKLESYPTNRRPSQCMWSPKGRFFVVSVPHLGSFNGSLTFVDGSKMETLETSEHQHMTFSDWDPSGRYFVSWISVEKFPHQTGYVIYDGRGSIVARDMREGLRQFSWRPRPKRILTNELDQEVKKNLKKLSKEYDEMDAKLRLNTQMEEQARKDLVRKLWRTWEKNHSGEVAKRRAAVRDLLAHHEEEEDSWEWIEISREEIVEETEEDVVEGAKEEEEEEAQPEKDAKGKEPETENG